MNFNKFSRALAIVELGYLLIYIKYRAYGMYFSITSIPLSIIIILWLCAAYIEYPKEKYKEMLDKYKVPKEWG